jgi:hypothetical protein
MLNKFKEITQAWISAYNPTEKQKELAEARFKICDVCDKKKVITDKLKIGVICDQCGCPISKKVFSSTYNACPLEKWEEVDSVLWGETQKKTKTLL